jgi:uncharacterized protein YcbX
MAGESLEEVIVTLRGLLGDRAYALIDQETGKAVSAKNPRRWPGMLHHRATFPQAPQANQPPPPAHITLQDGTTLTTDAPDASARLSALLGRPVRIATVPEGSVTAEGYWPDQEWLPDADRDQVFDFHSPPGTFFDGAMVHLVTSATLRALALRTPESRIETARFRPNFLIETPDDATGFVENDWIGRTLHIGEIRLRVDGPCPRCVMTTLPQGDLPADPAVLRAAVHGNSGNVGLYATVLRGGTVRRGDPVTQG